MPIKEISAESVRDKSIRHGHISTLHLWWARRPLPVCRAIVFASLVPDPLDENCPEAFQWAVQTLLADGMNAIVYKPYKDIPYTAIVDEMEDNLRHRLMMFIGKFSDKCQANMLAGKSTSPKEQLSDGSLIKWENKNNPKILRMARELIFVAYQSDLRPDATWEALHEEFNRLYDAIPEAENALYSMPDRHIETAEVTQREAELKNAIEAFQNQMPSVFDPFAGGGAIPLEAARLGCRSYGNDINPVAHIIERGSAEFPQKYGKPIVYSLEEFQSIYGEEGIKMTQEKDRDIRVENGFVHISNRLAFDVEYYAKKILKESEKEVGYLYPADEKGNKPVAYYWARTAKCSNPSCGAEIPMLKQFYLANTTRNKIYFNPIIKGQEIDFEILKGQCSIPGYMKGRECSVTCPCCNSITSGQEVKQQSYQHKTGIRLMAVIKEGLNGKEYCLPNKKDKEVCSLVFNEEKPTEKLPENDTQNLKISHWGYKTWGDIYSDRQIHTLNCILKKFEIIKQHLSKTEYGKVTCTLLAIWFDRIVLYNTTFGRYDISRENIQHPYSKQALPMMFDYPESNPFCYSSGSASNQLDWLLRFLESENESSFTASFLNSSSGEKGQFDKKGLTAVVTDPPYYDAIAYADLSDFFYVWLKRTLFDVYPIVFSTPQTPKSEECTAIKHHHNGSILTARNHFKHKLTQIFDAIEQQTSDVVSIMFAHQSTEAWTTLCDSILGARMNITGSWPMDTEMANRSIGIGNSALESSVTVACRPSERKGYADYNDIKHEIKQVVKAEVEKLYELGFRGADLLTACFGQAVSVFGHYKRVETSEGDPVTVGQLLDFARESAAQALLEGVPGEPQTKFYCGWLQMNGMGDTSFDDVNKFTRVGVNVEIRQLQQDRLLISNGSKQHLANAEEHIGDSTSMGKSPEDYLISQIHRMMLSYRNDDQAWLLKLVRELCPQSDAPHWRVLAFLKEHLPDGKDLDDAKGLLASAEMLRQRCKEAFVPRQTTIEFED